MNMKQQAFGEMEGNKTNLSVVAEKMRHLKEV
jgi:hypothetical protein